MRHFQIIGILCMMLAAIGIASADTFTFGDTSGGTYATGQITFDENGIVNGACIAGVTNGEMDVQQDSSQNGGNIAVWQYGDIEGDSGFAGTLVDGGNGNQGGTFASFSSGGMVFGQVSAGGEIESEFIPDFPLESSGNQLLQVGDVSSSLNGVIAGQFAGIEGSSGYAATTARNAHGASGQSTASFSDGGMIVGQVSGVGEISSINSDGLGVSIPVMNQDVVFSGQIGGIQADSGSASTTGRTDNGALARTDVSFTDGTICFGQLVDGESFSFSGVLGPGVGVSGISYDGIESYQSVESEQFSTIAASTYSQLADSSYAQVNAAAAGSGIPISGKLSKPSPGNYFSTTQYSDAESSFYSPVTHELGVSRYIGSEKYVDAWEYLDIYGVESGSAGASATDSNGNTAWMTTYTSDGNLVADDIWAYAYQYTYPPAGNIGNGEDYFTAAVVAFDEMDITGSSGAILLDSQNSIGDFTNVHARFSGSGNLYASDGLAGAGNDEDNYIVEAESNLAMYGSPATYLLETGTSDNKYAHTSVTNTISYAHSWGEIGPGINDHFSEIL